MALPWTATCLDSHRYDIIEQTYIPPLSSECIFSSCTSLWRGKNLNGILNGLSHCRLGSLLSLGVGVVREVTRSVSERVTRDVRTCGVPVAIIEAVLGLRAVRLVVDYLRARSKLPVNMPYWWQRYDESASHDTGCIVNIDKCSFLR